MISYSYRRDLISPFLFKLNYLVLNLLGILKLYLSLIMIIFLFKRYDRHYRIRTSLNKFSFAKMVSYSYRRDLISSFFCSN